MPAEPTEVEATSSAPTESSVADAMADVDWDATGVGPPTTWPSLLDSLVRVVLASKFSMWLGWGAELSFFYNDAYRRDTLGVKHPWALGKPAAAVWAEIWEVIGPRLAHVLEGKATWDEALLLFLERSGYREETYHTFSYSPITEADGSVAGVLCVVSEETERVIGERRLATLRQLASELSGARREEEVFAVVEGELGKNPYDVPYALVYVFDDDGTARLACAAGAAPTSPVAAARIEPGDPPRSWPMDELRAANRTVLVDDVVSRLGDAPSGGWDVPAGRAVLVPLSQQGQGAPAGVLVAGANPYRPLDEHAVAFVELLAGQIAAGLANARAYEAERRRAEALTELDRAKTEFFSNVSHEFRTPLTLILGPAEDALGDEDEPLAPGQTARLEVIRRNARRLRRLVNDMLDFARIEGGRLRAETLPTDLAELTRDIARSFAPAIERAGLSLVIDCPPLGREAYVDRDMWEKIVLNLLSNALKFTLEGAIRVGLRGEEDVIVLTVSDSGVGVPAAQLPRLFERFYRAPSGRARSHEGTGIGLALVSELVHLHEGTIGAASEEGRGATFTVRLPWGTGPTATGPVQRESARQAYLDEALQWLPVGAPAEGAELGVATARGGGSADATVLVVDDNPDMRRYVARVLEPFWQVRVANEGAAALEAVRQRRPDLVLTDVMMPELDGFGLLAALRADPQTATIPVVFLSARAGEDAAVEGLDAGADDYLVKPFSSLELVARVRSNLDLAAMRNQESAWRTALIETLDEAVVVMDAAGTIVEANDAFERILGFPRADLPYRPPFPWLPPPDGGAAYGGAVGELFDRVRRDGRFRGTVDVRHRDGHPLQVAAAVDSVDLAGERRYVAAFRDVTAELLAAERESALAQLSMRLAEAGDVEQVARAGLDELARVFRAVRAGIARPGEGGRPVRPAGDHRHPGRAAAAVAGAWERRHVAFAGAPQRAAEPPGVVAVAAPLDPAGDAGIVWIEFERPRHVSSDERALFAVLCGYFGQALRRAQLFDDNRRVATAMQRSILGPTETPAGIAVRYLPAVQPLEVGGDWYDVIELPGDRLGLVVGDCVGRGLPAATVMGQLRSACRALLLQAQAPAEVVAALDAFAERIPGATCTTVFCGILDLATNELRLCSAGHVPGVLVDASGAAELVRQGGSVPLGVVAGVARTESTLRLPGGSSLVLCTDGLVERRDESLDVGLERLAAAASAGSGLPPEALADHLVRSLVPAGGQEDDVALVVCRRPHPSDGPFAATVPADPAELPALRRSLRAWLAGRLGSPAEVTAVLVAAGEAVANAIEHAYGSRGAETVRVSAHLDGGALEVRVADEGRWKDASPAAGERGRGLAIMEGLMDGVEIDHDERGTTVVLRKEVQPGAR